LSLFWLSSSCVLYGASFSGLSLRYSLTLMETLIPLKRFTMSSQRKCILLEIPAMENLKQEIKVTAIHEQKLKSWIIIVIIAGAKMNIINKNVLHLYKCWKCHKKDNFAIVYGGTQNTQQRKKSFSSNLKGQHGHYVEDSESEDDWKLFSTVPQKHVDATMHVNGKPIKFQVDRGESCNVIPISMLQDVDYKLTKSKTVLTTNTQRKKLNM